MEVGNLPNHVNSCIFCVCLLFNFCLFTIIDLSPGGAICTTSGIKARLGFNPLNAVNMLSTKYNVERFCS